MANIVQWRNQGETSHFPFRETANLRTSRNIQLPDQFLSDAQILVPNQLSHDPIFLSQLVVSGNMVQGTISSGRETIGFFVADAGILEGGSTVITTDGGFARGRLVFGARAWEVFSALSLGVNSFTEDQTEFEASCLIPLPANIVTGLTVAGETYGGKVGLVEGIGIRLVKLADNSFRIDAVGDTGEREKCCRETLPPIRTINAIDPDPNGNFSIELGSYGEPTSPQDLRQVLRFRQIANGLEFYLAK